MFVSFAGHDGGDRATERPAFHAVVTVTVTHDKRADIRVTEPERAEDMRVLRDFFDRIARVIDNDLLRSDENAHRRFESLDIKIAVGGLELHQIKRREIAGRVVEEEVLTTWVGRILPACAFTGVPFVDRRIELHSGIATDPSALGDFSQ